jgi:hypothetical protein
VLLRILGGDRGGQEQSLGRLAAALAVSGDPELLRVALALTGGAVPLPGGEAGAVEVDPDETGETGSQAGAARARVTLHSPELGPIEIALTLTSATIAAAVTVEPGRPAKVAQAALDDLREALERSTDRQAGATVSARQPQERRPAPPLPVDWVDVRA